MRLPETVADGRRWVFSALAAVVGAVVVLTATELGDAPPRTSSTPSAESVSSAPACAGELEAPSSAPSAPPTRDPAAGPPLRLQIPAIGVVAEVVPIGLSGTVLEPPVDVDLVGWWDGGADAGAAHGAVLLTGHSVHAGDGVFDRLGELRIGDQVPVTTAGGTITYEVSSVAAYSKKSLAARAESLFSSEGSPRLALATCSGYDGEQYTQTTIVLATPTG